MLFPKPSKRPGQVQKPILKKPVPKGLFGEKSFRSFMQLREFARKAPYRSYSRKSSKKLGKKQRVDLINKWRVESKRLHGFSERDFDLLMRKKKKEKIWASPSRRKELQVEIDTMESLKKGI